MGLASDVIASSYSSLGRHAKNPNLLIKSFILMNHLGYTSIHTWCDSLKNDNVLKFLLGTDKALNVSNHYDFIQRFTCKVHSRNELVKKDFFIKPKDKLKKGEKLIVKNTMSYTSSLLYKYKNGTDPDIRVSGPLSYKSHTWKEIYKNRTSTGRKNNRVLNDYKLHQLRVRDLAKNAFFCFIASMNIHLDIWKKLEEAT